MFFGVLVDSIGDGPLLNVFLSAYFDYFARSSRLHFFLQNIVPSPCFWTFGDSIGGGGPLVNKFLRAYFNVLRQRSRFHFHLKIEFILYLFGVLVDSIGGGTLVNMFLRA